MTSSQGHSASQAVSVLATLTMALILGVASPVRAQTDFIDGHVSIMFDALPNAGEAVELRVQVFLERRVEIGEWLTLMASGWVEGLTARRQQTTVRDAVARPHELYADLKLGALDVRVGLANVVWGRLDEIQPTDVIDPLDASKYLFEGRGAARLPVLLTRVRWRPSEAASLEAVWAPVFRRGRFDYLGEPTSPFNLTQDLRQCPAGGDCPPQQVIVNEPPPTFSNSQGGARLGLTSGRVDWSVGAYRGIEPFGAITAAQPPGSIPPQLVETFPWFTVITGDFETARGAWAWRGEVAAFLRDLVVLPDSSGQSGHSLQFGIGVDREVADVGYSGTILFQRREADEFEDTDVSLVFGGTREFARQTRRVRGFGTWNVTDGSTFLRTIGEWSLRDDLWLEGSIGWFAGTGDDTLSRFSTRDFVYVRLKAYF